MHATYVKMKYFCGMILLNCLIDSSFLMEITIASANVTFLGVTEQSFNANQTSITKNLNKTSFPVLGANITKNMSSPENTTENYVSVLKTEAFAVQNGCGNKTSDEAIAVNAYYNGFGLTELAGIATVSFLVFAVFGYFGFVFLRKYLVNRYGNSQALITEDEYDTSDLRNFTI